MVCAIGTALESQLYESLGPSVPKRVLDQIVEHLNKAAVMAIHTKRALLGIGGQLENQAIGGMIGDLLAHTDDCFE